MESFIDLEAWKKGMLLVKEIYRLSKKFPKEEQFGLTSQIRKSATSTLANLAEGFGRASPPDKAHKYTIARGENSETHAFLFIAIELGFITKDDTSHALDLCAEVGRILTGLIQVYSSYS